MTNLDSAMIERANNVYGQIRDLKIMGDEIVQEEMEYINGMFPQTLNLLNVIFYNYVTEITTFASTRLSLLEIRVGDIYRAFMKREEEESKKEAMSKINNLARVGVDLDIRHSPDEVMSHIHVEFNTENIDEYYPLYLNACASFK